MKKLMIIAALTAAILNASAGLIPDTITLTWSRTDLSDYADKTNIYLSGVTYRLTNCVANVSSAVGTNTPAVAQDLTGLTVILRVGDGGTNVAYVGHPAADTNGLFSADIQFPRWLPGPSRSTTGQEGIELKISDTNAGTTVTYKARKLFTVMQPLH